MWVQLSEIGEISNYNKVLLLYRSHDEQSTSLKNKSKIDGNTWIVNQYQLKKMGLDLPEHQVRLLRIQEINNIKTLDKICELLTIITDGNSKSKYLNEELLARRSHKQLFNLINSIRNPFKLLFLLLKKNYHNVASEVVRHRFRAFFKKKRGNDDEIS